MAPRKKYTDKFKAGVVVLLQSENYPADPYAIERVAKQVKVPGRTIRRWFNGEHGQPPDDVVTDTKKELKELFEDEIRAIMMALPDKREDANYKDAVMAAAILTDKKQLLEGGATSRNELTGKDGGPIEHRVNTEQFNRALTSLADAFRDVVSIPASQGSSAVDASE